MVDDEVTCEISSAMCSRSLVTRCARLRGGQEALAVLSDFDPDLLIVDFAMPNMNGAEIVTPARARKPIENTVSKRLCGYRDTRICCREGPASAISRFGPAELAAAVRTALDA